MPLRLDNPRVSVDLGDGWQELHGIRDVQLDPMYDPPDPIEGYGLGKMRGILAALEEWAPAVTPVELALLILRPHLDRERLYVG